VGREGGPWGTKELPEGCKEQKKSKGRGGEEIKKLLPNPGNTTNTSPRGPKKENRRISGTIFKAASPKILKTSAKYGSFPSSLEGKKKSHYKKG